MRASTLALLLILLGCFAFFNAIMHPFVHDDVAFIVQNPNISHLDHLDRLFVSPTTTQAGINPYYRPILEIVYRLEYRFFGFNATGFHSVNLCIHIFNGLLLFALLLRLGISKSIAWAVAAIFLVHPVQSEAVACVSGISNLLMAFFVLLTLYTYVRGYYFVAMLLLMVGLLTKEQALMTPLLIVAMDIYRRQNAAWKYWGMAFITVFVFMIWRQHMSGTSVVHDILASPGELVLRLKAIAHVLLMDLRLIIAPYDLHYYRNTDILAPVGLSWLYLFLIMAAFAFVAHHLKDMKGLLWWGAAWFILSLLPVLNIVPLINEYSFILTADHFLYLPMIGIVLILVVLVDRFLNTYGRTILAIVLALCIGLTIYLNTFWRNEVALFERTVHYEPRFARGHLLLAKAYYFNGQYQRAMPEFQQALDIMTTYEQKAGNAMAKDIYQGFEKEISFDMDQTSVQIKNTRQR